MVVALNRTALPAQTDVEPVLIATLGVTAAVTVMVNEFEVTVAGTAQPPLAVTSQVTTSLLVKLVEVKLALVALATGDPFTFH